MITVFLASWFQIRQTCLPGICFDTMQQLPKQTPVQDTTFCLADHAAFRLPSLGPGKFCLRLFLDDGSDSCQHGLGVALLAFLLWELQVIAVGSLLKLRPATIVRIRPTLRYSTGPLNAPKHRLLTPTTITTHSTWFPARWAWWVPCLPR